GVWRTEDGGATWTPLTDQFPSLSIGAIAISPLDNAGGLVTGATPRANLVLFAGIGQFSNSWEGGLNVGLLRSTDGGDTWTLVAPFTLAGLPVTAVMPTAIGTSLADQVVLVATLNKLGDDGEVAKQGGIFRSTDGGVTFERVLDGSATDLVADPGNANRYYAAIRGTGVHRSTDGGETWTAVNNAALNLTSDTADNDGDGTADNATETGAGAARIVLAVQQGGGAGNAVFAALIGESNERLMGVFRSTDQGASWAAIGTAPAIHPGGQGIKNFSMVADSTGNNVFVGGDRQAVAPFVGNLFVGNVGTGTWTSVVLGGAAGTAPHADSRDMVFDANGNILEGDDGGIYRLVNPLAGGRSWQSANGNLRITESPSAAYDALNDVILVGNQDTGSAEQRAGLGLAVDANGDGVPDDAATRFVWSQITQGDGNTQAIVPIDTDSDGVFDQSLRFTMGNNFRTFRARTFDAAGLLVSNNPVGLRSGPAAAVRSGLDPADKGFTGFAHIPYVANAVDSSRMLIGLFSLYESTDRLETVSSILTSTASAGASLTFSNHFNALAYGGRKGATEHADVIYAARGNKIYVRGAGETSFETHTIKGAGRIGDIVLDPDDWETAYAIDGDKVYKTTNAGEDWVVVSQRLRQFDLQAVEFVETATDDVLLVGGTGGVYRAFNPAPDVQWTEFGIGLPNALVGDIDFIDRFALPGGHTPPDVLLAGTFGRGTWTVGFAD
ncbi:MAG TPA: sialidase family protein, partial [Acidimicrobiia bacterium]|nr:sialidase family protein [Acidimicrobiia bacterium]